MKPGTEYELFVKEIYKALNDCDGISNLNIQHNIKLAGAAGVAHQIDVYWEFCMGTVNYRVAVECKDYKTSVSKDKIMAFHAVLTDIGNIHGIFVTSTGFQSGAKEYAEKYGIQLMEIRKPNDKDWDGRIRDCEISIVAKWHENVHPKFNLDWSRIDDKIKEKIVAGESEIRLPGMLTDRVYVEYDEDADTALDSEDEIDTQANNRPTRIKKSILNLTNSLPVGDAGRYEHVFTFKNGELKYFENGEEIKWPVVSAKFIYDVVEYATDSLIKGDEAIRALVKNITTGVIKIVDSYGAVRNAPTKK